MHYFILILILVQIPDYYIWANFVRGIGVWIDIFYWIPAILMIGTVIGAISGYFNNWTFNLIFILFLCVSLPKALFFLISIAGKLASLLYTPVYQWFNVLGLTVSILLFGCAVFGFVAGWKKIYVREEIVESKKLPASFNGFKIVQLSDFHIGTYKASPQSVKKIVAYVNSLNPDIIMFTGDLVNSQPSELNTFMSELKKMKSKYGVYSVMGNHDYCMYYHYSSPEGAEQCVAKLRKMESELGWKLLSNEHFYIKNTDSIAIIGVENAGKSPFPAKSDLHSALKGVPADTYKILLSHDPSHWRREVLPDTDIDLMLSGHTHAMQLKIGGFSPAKWLNKEWGGKYTIKERVLNVSLGIGSNVPFRFGAWPEIDVIKLYSK